MLWIPLRSSWTRFSEDTQDSKEIKALIQGVQSTLLFFSFFFRVYRNWSFFFAALPLYTQALDRAALLGKHVSKSCKCLQDCSNCDKRLGDVHTMVSERIKRGEQHDKCPLNKHSNSFILACMHHIFLFVGWTCDLSLLF